SAPGNSSGGPPAPAPGAKDWVKQSRVPPSTFSRSNRRNVLGSSKVYCAARGGSHTVTSPTTERSAGPPQENEQRPPGRRSTVDTGSSQTLRWSPVVTTSQTTSMSCGYQRSCRIVCRSTKTASIRSAATARPLQVVEVVAE